MGSLGRLLIGPRLGRIGLARLLVRVRVGRLHPIGRGILPGHGPGLLLAVSAVGQAGEPGKVGFPVAGKADYSHNAYENRRQVHQHGKHAERAGEESEKSRIIGGEKASNVVEQWTTTAVMAERPKACKVCLPAHSSRSATSTKPKIRAHSKGWFSMTHTNPNIG